MQFNPSPTAYMAMLAVVVNDSPIAKDRKWAFEEFLKWKRAYYRPEPVTLQLCLAEAKACRQAGIPTRAKKPCEEPTLASAVLEFQPTIQALEDLRSKLEKVTGLGAHLVYSKIFDLWGRALEPVVLKGLEDAEHRGDRHESS